MTVPAQRPVREGHIAVPGGRLWYWDTGGAGPPVVLSHPSSGSALSWPYQQPVLHDAGYRVIAYSRLGHHRSSPADPADPGTGAGDLGALADQLGLARVHLVGAAGGANAVLDYTLCQPENVSSLAVLSSYLGITEPDYVRRCSALRPPGLHQLPNWFLELSPAYRANDSIGTQEWISRSDRSLTGARVPQQPSSSTVTWSTLETIGVPLLLMTGDADLYWPPALMQMVADHLPRASTIIFHTAGHSAAWERPGAFNAALLTFLRGEPVPRESRW